MRKVLAGGLLQHHVAGAAHKLRREQSLTAASDFWDYYTASAFSYGRALASCRLWPLKAPSWFVPAVLKVPEPEHRAPLLQWGCAPGSWRRRFRSHAPRCASAPAASAPVSGMGSQGFHQKRPRLSGVTCESMLAVRRPIEQQELASTGKFGSTCSSARRPPLDAFHLQNQVFGATREGH